MNKVKQLADELYNQIVLNGWKNVSMETCLEIVTDHCIMDKLVKKLTIPVVSHSKNLTLLEAIENTKQLPQVQYDLQRQLRELRVMANKLGLYDAADFIKSYCG